MLGLLRNRWFLISLLVLIASGLAIGRSWPAERVEVVTGFFEPPTTTIIVGTVLFLMAFSLDTRQLHASLRAPGPVAWASFTTMSSSRYWDGRSCGSNSHPISLSG